MIFLQLRLILADEPSTPKILITIRDNPDGSYYCCAPGRRAVLGSKDKGGPYFLARRDPDTGEVTYTWLPDGMPKNYR